MKKQENQWKTKVPTGAHSNKPLHTLLWHPLAPGKKVNQCWKTRPMPSYGFLLFFIVLHCFPYCPLHLPLTSDFFQRSFSNGSRGFPPMGSWVPWMSHWTDINESQKLKFESQFESPTPGVHVVQGTTVSIRGCIASKPFFRILLAPLPMSLVGRIADDKYFLVLATSAFTWRFSFWAWFASMLSSLPTAFSTALVLDSPSANNCVTNNQSRRTFVSDRTPLSVTVATSIRLSYMLSHGNLFVIIGLRSSSEMILSLSTPWYSTGDFQNSSNIFWVLVEVLQHLSSNIWAFVEKTLALQLHMETTN